MKINKKSIVYSMTLLCGSSAVLQMLGTIYRIIIARLTGAEGMGVFHLVFPFYTVVMAICISGLSVAVNRLSAEMYALHNENAIRRLIKISIVIFVFLIALVSIFTLIFLDQIASNILGDSRTKSAITGILVCLFFTGFENIYKSYFYGIKNVQPPITSDILEQIVRIISVTALLIILKPKDGGTCAALIVAGMIISEVVSSFFMKTAFERKIPSLHIENETRGIGGMIVAIALPVAFGSLANNILSAANTVLIPQRLVVSGLTQQNAIADLGILFGMVIPLLMMPGVFIGSLSTIMMPTLSQGMALNNFTDIRRKIGKAFRATGVFTFPSITIMIALGSEICFELYGQSNTHIFIVPLAISSVFVYFQIISGSILHGLGLQRIATINIIIAGVLQLAFTYFLTADPRFGIFGYITGYLISDIVLMILNMYFVLSKTKLKVQWGSWFILPAISSTFVGILTRMVFAYMIDRGINQPLSIIGAILVGVGIYFILLKVEGLKIRKYLKSIVY